MSAPAFEEYRAIDTDTHITEPADLWTSRVASKWGEAIPHIERIEGRDVWLIEGQPCGAPGPTTMAGFDGSYPEGPMGYDDIPKSAYDSAARIEHMDAEGIQVQVLYPNVGGFGSGGFLRLKEPELMLECVRAYNDFLVEWASVAPERLVAVAAMPFWDRDQAVAEVQRAASIGHKAVLACSEPQAFGQPRLADAHWDPFWAAAQEAGVSISFHIGAGDLSDLVNDSMKIGTRANFGRISSLVFMQNANCFADLIFGGVCHRFPNLDMVSVESGVGWIPTYLEMADWQWVNGQIRKEHPEYDLLPSEYFRRQIYGCFWLEREGMHGAVEQYVDNILWETDFPHPTCQHPGLVDGLAQHPRDYVEAAMGHLNEETRRKILHDNAAKLYGLD
ncbi:amidohydrolase family protein [Myxococcota bacterium]|nr:amidohydrolase family protein [Myxococcota bacterium]